jgi:Zn-dependent protease
MLFRLAPEVLILLIPVLVFALVFHEFSHAWVANQLGDPTAKYAGRLTLNPLAHLDIFGSLMILFVGFGWAKPVPVDSRYLGNPRIDMMKIAFAGPASNLLLALISGTIIRTTGYMGSLTTMLVMFTQINIMLAVFNMIPISPLDGSQIFSGFMVRRNPDMVYKLQIYGPQILMGLILFGMFTRISPIWWVMRPFVDFFMFLFAGM